MTDDPTDDDEDGGGGYRRPPKNARYAKGQSGNPAGRPRGRRQEEAPYEAVLGQMVTIREDGVERRVSAEEAFLLVLLKRGLEGDGVATRATQIAIDIAAKRRTAHWDPIVITHMILAPGSVTLAAQHLRMARKLDPYRETARMVLEPWIIEVALARLREKLSSADQRTIEEAARTPHNVKWPVWWSEHP
jgi:hypothetical protein